MTDPKKMLRVWGKVFEAHDALEVAQDAALVWMGEHLDISLSLWGSCHLETLEQAAEDLTDAETAVAHRLGVSSETVAERGYELWLMICENAA